MADSTQRLANLPQELLHSIFRQLDPVALIATSQTCTYFRSIIQPARAHFAERLLALELEGEHGGPGFTYFARENRLEPDWNEEVWNRMRWTCTRCLRLLSHASFDNHSILRLKNRKPTPGSPAAIRFSGVTSWEPVESRALSAKDERKRRMLVAEDKAREKLLKKQYHLATTKTLSDVQSTYTSNSRTSYLRASELPEALGLSEAQLDSLTEEQVHVLLDRAAQRIEGLRAGSHRHMRKCNECRFQLGHFKKGPFIAHRIQRPGQPDELFWAFNNNKGTLEVPIVRSRRLKFATPFDRYFPGIELYMSTERPTFILPLQRIYREDTTYMASTLYMARCPSCATWQELREFRWRPRGWGYGEFIGIRYCMTRTAVAAHSAEVGEMQCNKCVHDKLGHTGLAQQLSTLMRALLETESHNTLDVLSSGWGFLRSVSPELQRWNRHRVKQLLKSLEAAENNFARLEHSDGWTMIDFKADNVADNLAVMNRRRQEWLLISREEIELANRCAEKSKLFAVWQNDWDGAMEYWQWTRAWLRETEEQPERVVRWALKRYGFTRDFIKG